MKKILIHKENFLSISPTETFKKASSLKPDKETDIFLNGKLGSGKTTFAKGIAHSLGIDPNEITSPTFSIMNIHHANNISIIHIDLYRINSKKEVNELYVEDYQNNNSISIIEWGEKYIDILANGKNIIIVNMKTRENYMNKNDRRNHKDRRNQHDRRKINNKQKKDKKNQKDRRNQHNRRNQHDRRKINNTETRNITIEKYITE